MSPTESTLCSLAGEWIKYDKTLLHTENGMRSSTKTERTQVVPWMNPPCMVHVATWESSKSPTQLDCTPVFMGLWRRQNYKGSKRSVDCSG